MKILSIDTSSKNCSVSIIESIQDSSNTLSKNVDPNTSFEVLITKNNNDEKTHSQKLMPLINEMFDEINMSLGDIDLLVSCVGPGSFTGIRIGVSTVKAFSDAKNIPTVGVTSLESLSCNISEKGFVIPIIDAKNNNAYSAMYSNTQNDDIHKILKTEISDFAENISNILDIILDYISKNHITAPLFFVGDGCEIYKGLILEKFQGYLINFSSNNSQNSISLGKCGYSKYVNGIYGNSNFINPIYLRKSQAERTVNG